MFTTIQLGKTRDIRADYIQDILIKRKFYCMAKSAASKRCEGYLATVKTGKKSKKTSSKAKSKKK